MTFLVIFLAAAATCLLSTYYIPDSVLNVGDSSEHDRQGPRVYSLYILVWDTDNKKVINTYGNIRELYLL